MNQQPDHPFEQVMREEKIKPLFNYNIEKVLDIGGGDGSVWKSNKFHTIDLWEPDIELANKAFENKVYDFIYPVKPVSADILQYDILTILGVLEHVDNPFDLLVEYSSANSLYLTVPNANSLHRYLGLQLGVIDSIDELGPQDLNIGHKRVFKFDSFISMIKDFCKYYDFNLVEAGTIGLKFGTYDQMMPWKDIYHELSMVGEHPMHICGRNAPNGAEIYAFLEKK